MRKNCSSDQEKNLKFEAEGQESAKISISLGQFCSNSERSEQLLVTECYFNLICTYLINWNNQNSNWKQIFGFRNMQEKLEIVFCCYTFLNFL